MDSTTTKDNSHDVENHPDFAIVWSFFRKFGKQLEMEGVMITDVVKWFSMPSNQSSAIVAVMVKLMRKIGMRVDKQRWQKHLIKAAMKQDIGLAADLQSLGFHTLTFPKKLKLLKMLCEMQFDDNLKFKTAINNEDAEEQRLKPVGRDEEGLLYWHQEDEDLNIRVYIEDQDEDDDSGWKVVAKSKDEIAELIKKLTNEPTDKDKNENSDDEVDLVETKFQKFLKTQCTSESNDDKDEGISCIKTETFKNKDDEVFVKQENMERETEILQNNNGDIATEVKKEMVDSESVKTDDDISVVKACENHDVIKAETESNAELKVEPMETNDHDTTLNNTASVNASQEDQPTITDSKPTDETSDSSARVEDTISKDKLDIKAEVSVQEPAEIETKGQLDRSETTLPVQKSESNAVEVSEANVSQTVDEHTSADGSVIQNTLSNDESVITVPNTEKSEQGDSAVENNTVEDTTSISSKPTQKDISLDERNSLEQEKGNATAEKTHHSVSPAENNGATSKDAVSIAEETIIPVSVTECGTKVDTAIKTADKMQDCTYQLDVNNASKDDVPIAEEIITSASVIECGLKEDTIVKTADSQQYVPDTCRVDDDKDKNIGITSKDAIPIVEETVATVNVIACGLKEDTIVKTTDSQQDCPDSSQADVDRDKNIGVTSTVDVPIVEETVTPVNVIECGLKEDTFVKTTDCPDSSQVDDDRNKNIGVANEDGVPIVEEVVTPVTVIECGLIEDTIAKTTDSQQDCPDSFQVDGDRNKNIGVADKDDVPIVEEMVTPVNVIMCGVKEDTIVKTTDSQQDCPDSSQVDDDRNKNIGVASKDGIPIVEEIVTSVRVIECGPKDNTAVITTGETYSTSSQEDSNANKKAISGSEDGISVITKIDTPVNRDEASYKIDSKESLAPTKEILVDSTSSHSVKHGIVKNNATLPVDQSLPEKGNAEIRDTSSRPDVIVTPISSEVVAEEDKADVNISQGDENGPIAQEAPTDTTDCEPGAKPNAVLEQKVESETVKDAPMLQEKTADLPASEQFPVPQTVNAKEPDKIVEDNKPSCGTSTSEITSPLADSNRIQNIQPHSEVLHEKTCIVNSSTSDCAPISETVRDKEPDRPISKPPIESAKVSDDTNLKTDTISSEVGKPDLDPQDKIEGETVVDIVPDASKNLDDESKQGVEVKTDRTEDINADNVKPEEENKETTDINENDKDEVCNGGSDLKDPKDAKSDEKIDMNEDDVDGDDIEVKPIQRKKGKRRKRRAGARKRKAPSTPRPISQSSTPRQKKPKISRLAQLQVEAESILHMGEKKSQESKDSYRTRSGRRVKNAKKDEEEVWQTLGDDDKSSSNRRKSENDEDFQYVESKRGKSSAPARDSTPKKETKRLADDEPCMKCGLSSHPETILLCDNCDKGHHMACLTPPLMIIPDDDWFCPKCSKEKLIARLREICDELESKMKLQYRKTRQNEYKKLLNEYTGISATNIISQPAKVEKPNPVPKKRPKSYSSASDSEELLDDNSYSSPSSPELKPTRRCRTKKISYDFSTFDKTILDAIGEDIDVKPDLPKEKPISGKDIRTIIAAEKGEDAKELMEDKSDPMPGKRKKRKLTNLNSDEEAVESGSNYSMSESDDEMSEEEFIASNNTDDSDDSLTTRRRRRRGGKESRKPLIKPIKRSKRLRRKRIQEDDESSMSESESTEYEDEPKQKKRKKKSKWNGYGRVSSEEEYVPPRTVRDFIDDDENEEKERTEKTKKNKRRAVRSSSEDEDAGKKKESGKSEPRGKTEKDDGELSSDDWSSLSSNAAQSSDERSLSDGEDTRKNQRTTAAET